MKLHWKILIWLAAGVVVGAILSRTLEGPGWIRGIQLPAEDTVPMVITGVSPGSPADKQKIPTGQQILAITLQQGTDDEQVIPIANVGAFKEELGKLANGDSIWITFQDAPENVVKRVPLGLAPGCQLDTWLEPFRFIADVFMRLLKMLIIPMVLTSIISGVAGIGGGKDFGRLGGKTLGYYLTTSLLAAMLGLVLINLINPGEGADLGLGPKKEEGQQESLADVLREAVPSNVFHAFSDPNNRQMLQVIIFAILFGFFIGKTPPEHRERMLKFFSSAFEVMLAMARFVMALVPYGVFALLVKVVGETGIQVFQPLLWYMFTIALGLLIHAFVTLPLLLRFVGGVSPRKWAQAMNPALMTAFSTSSSSGTLPVTLDTVQERGKVSNRTSSFVLPLGATVNMDGTALYECCGVIFLSQYYASLESGVATSLTLGDQVFVVFLALLASIGAAGIPSAGLVMMVTILSALKMPIEGAALLLAVDRPLDMMRTVVNVWSDTCGTAVIAGTEGENFPARIGYQEEPPGGG